MPSRGARENETGRQALLPSPLSRERRAPALIRSLRKRFSGLLLGLVLIFLYAPLALAHAYLVKSDPPVGSSLEQPPEHFRIFFSEQIERKFSSFALYDARGDKLLDLNPVLESGGLTVRLDVEKPLDSGVYTLAWQVLSAVDGHVTQGTIPFAIGGDAPALKEPTQATAQPSWERLLVRWLGFLAAMILVGSLFFPLMLPGQVEIHHEPGLQKLLWGSWGLLLLTGLADLQLQAVMLQAPFHQMLFESRWGAVQLAKYSFVLALGITFWSGLDSPVSRWLSRGLAGLLLLATSMSGHSAALGPLGVLADWVHQLAVALWLSGLVQLAAIWIPKRKARSPQEQVELLRILVPRFSDMALLSVLLLLGSGLYTAVRHIPSWEALVTTLYGQALLAKHVLLLPILALAAVNRFVLKPKLSAPGHMALANPHPQPNAEPVERTLARFRKLIISEALIAAIVLLLAGLLTLTAPPAARSALTAMPSAARPQLFIHPFGEYTVALSVSPAQVGKNLFEVILTDAEGAPVSDALKVWLEFVYLDQELGTVTAVAEPLPNGRYRVEGVLFSLPGNWHITVWARLKGRAEDLKAEFHLIVERSNP